MNILVVCPTHNEYVAMKRTVNNTECSHSYTVIESGVGKASAAASTALALYSPKAPHYDLIAVIGYAAANLPYKQGDLVIPTHAQYTDANCPPSICPEIMRVYELASPGATDTTFIGTADSFVDAAFTASHPHIGLFDMEATAVCQVAEAAETPVCVVKLVSDVPSEGHSAQTFEEFSASNKEFPQIVAYLEYAFE